MNHSEQLAAIPARWATPDPATLARLPKPLKRDSEKGRCKECGGWHGLPAIHLDYMGHAEITLALIEIDPLWSWEPLGVVDGIPVIVREGARMVLWARLTVCGKSIIGVGTCESGKSDPEKELIGDFLRNAAMRFGVATKLWSKATDADPVSAGREVRDPVAVLFDRVKAAKGTPVADELKEFAASSARSLSPASLAADPEFAYGVETILNKGASV